MKIAARMMARLRFLVLFATATTTFNTTTLWAQGDSQVYIKIGEAAAKKSVLALPRPKFSGTPGASPSHAAIGSELFRVIQNDLSVSGYFQFLSEKAFLEDPEKTGLKPQPTEADGFKFESWQQAGAEFLIRLGYSIAGDTLTLETFIYHVAKNQLIAGKRYKGPVKAARRVAHSFTNDLLEALTGLKGPFLSKVVAASDRGGGDFKEIYVMDWDGANVEKISNHKTIALSPTWSPDASKVAYTAFVQRAKSKTRNADLFLYEVLTGKRWLVSYRQGMNSGASFMRDGQNIILTLSQSGNPDIYKMNLEGQLISRLTNGPRGAMNVEPAVSPDNKKIAFTSDRSGQTMIYTMNMDGSGVTRLTFAGKFNASPAWSPDGKFIAFAGWGEDHFDIFRMNADGTNMIRITSAKKANGKWAQNEDPVFSSDGRFLMYTSNRTGKNQIFVSTADGSEERRITDDKHNYFKPKWSENVE